MKKIIAILLIISTNSLFAAGTCDWGTIRAENGNYTYSPICHLQVGKTIKDLEIKQEQIDLLNKSLDLKDQALAKAEERVVNYQEATYKLEDRILTHEKWSRLNDWMYFFAGILTAIGTGFLINRATK